MIGLFIDARQLANLVRRGQRSMVSIWLLPKRIVRGLSHLTQRVRAYLAIMPLSTTACGIAVGRWSACTLPGLGLDILYRKSQSLRPIANLLDSMGAIDW